MTHPIDVKANPVLTLTLDLPSLLEQGNLLDYDDETGEGRYAPEFVASVVREAAQLLVKQHRDELKDAIREQVTQQVHESVAKALDAPISMADRWGTPKGDAKPLRDVLADTAAAEVDSWMKRRDQYGDRKGFAEFLANEVDRAVRADLNEAVKAARVQVRQRMEQAAAQAIVDAAAAAVKGL